VAVPFAQVRGTDELARNLGCSVGDIQRYVDATDRRQFYHRIQIPKRGKRSQGQFRTVFKAEQRLALIQKNILAWISNYAEFPPYVQGFVQKRSIATNARIHLQSRNVLHADIRDFFGSIRQTQVVEAFRNLGCEPEVGETLAALCTLSERLPQGSSASPAIANIVCRNLDADLHLLASSNGCRYSRYADDITLSGDVLPRQAEIAAIVAKHGFQVRGDKCRVQLRGRGQFVTGLTIQDAVMPRVPRLLKRRLRLELHYAGRYGLADHLAHLKSGEDPAWALNRLGGWITFLFSIEGDAVKTLDRLCESSRMRRPRPFLIRQIPVLIPRLRLNLRPVNLETDVGGCNAPVRQSRASRESSADGSERTPAPLVRTAP
jgi:RNA-directed DNA polymerase